jgi:hypothetical protein
MCETKTTATWRSRRTRSTFISASVLDCSSAEVGSSRMRTRGCVTSALATSTSWRSASVSDPSGWRSDTSRPSSASTGRARRAISDLRTNGPRRGSRIGNRLLSTSRSGNRLSSWETTATPLRTASAVLSNATSRPSRRSVPSSGFTAPATIFTSVDLPAPFSPSSACTEPARTERPAPMRACTPP